MPLRPGPLCLWPFPLAGYQFQDSGWIAVERSMQEPQRSVSDEELHGQQYPGYIQSFVRIDEQATYRMAQRRGRA